MIGKILKFDREKIWVLEKEAKESIMYDLASWIKPEYIKLGEAEITIDSETGLVSFVAMVEGMADQDSKVKKSTKKSSKWEDDMVTFEDLLIKAHELGKPFSIKTRMLAVDLEKKYALFKAQVILESIEIKDVKIPGRIFEGHGDATNENVTGEFIKPHFIRMAETRAIVRALRWYTNNGCAEEEK